MSNIYDKLKHFNEVILKDATFERDKILHEIKNNEEERMDVEKKKLEEQADQLLKKETALAESLKNNVTSKAVLDGRQLLVKTREKIINEVLNDTKKLLEDFTQKDEYPPYLLQEIKQAGEAAGDGDLIFYLRKEDMQKFAFQLDQIKKDLPAHTIFEEIRDDIIGGCKVFNETRNIIVDNTLAGKLDKNKDKIFEICDLRINE